MFVTTSMGASISFVVGWLSWWAAEYLIHRFVGHGRSNLLSFSRHHKKHHSQGNYFAPLLDKARVSLTVTVIFGIGFGVVLGWANGLSLTGGFVLSYLTYEWLHRRAHSHPPKTKYGRWLRRHHFYHHFMNPNSNHGVTTFIGDILFQTKRIPQQIKVPEKLKMQWLTDPSTGEVWPEFSKDYVLMRSRKFSPNRRRNDNKAQKPNINKVLSMPFS